MFQSVFASLSDLYLQSVGIFKAAPFGSVPQLIRKLALMLWLSGLSTGLQTKWSPVRFPVRAKASVAGQVPPLKACKRQPIIVSLTHHCFSPSLPLPPSLKINKILKKKTLQHLLSYRQVFHVVVVKFVDSHGSNLYCSKETDPVR